jgi:hypothetical protein
MEEKSWTAQELAELARSAIAKVHEAMIPEVRLVRITASPDADTFSSWWELFAVFQVPLTASRAWNAWPRVGKVLTAGTRELAVTERSFLLLPSSIIEWDDRKFRDPVITVGTAIAHELGVPFYIPPVGSPLLEWWQEDAGGLV